MNSVDHGVTRSLGTVGAGDRQAAEELVPLVYGDLRRLAAWHIRSDPAADTLQATDLVHDAYLRLHPGEEQFDNRDHFFSAAARAMRRVLVDRARRRRAVRHGGEFQRTGFFEDGIAGPTGDGDELLAVHEALDRLAEIEPRKAEVVKLRYFMGMTIEETAEALGIGSATVRRDMVYAKAWLYRELTRESEV